MTGQWYAAHRAIISTGEGTAPVYLPWRQTAWDPAFVDSLVQQTWSGARQIWARLLLSVVTQLMDDDTPTGTALELIDWICDTSMARGGFEFVCHALDRDPDSTRASILRAVEMPDQELTQQARALTARPRRDTSNLSEGRENGADGQ